MKRAGRDCFFSFTVLGLSLAALMILSYYGSSVYALFDYMIGGQEAGVFRWLFWLFRSGWTSAFVQYAFAFGVPYLCAYVMMLSLPVVQGPKTGFSLEEFMVCLVTAAGIGYILNMGGNLIDAVFSYFNGKALSDMNPIVDAIEYTPSMIVYVCFLGPLMEELMFRGLLLSRARRFGDRTAVVFCAVAFGLMHGNLPQFFYATFVGLIFGYVAVKTNRLRYNVLLHITFNTYTMITTGALFFLEESGFNLLSDMYSIALTAEMVLVIIGGCYFFSLYAKKARRRFRAADGPRAPYKKYVYLNPGFLLYFGICAFEILSLML